MASIVNDTLASMGRKGDTLIAHINPREAAILKAFGGKGGINPQTGFLEFYDYDGFGGADQGGFGDTAMGGDFGGADQGGFADTAMGGYEGWGAVGPAGTGLSAADIADRNAILGDMARTAELNRTVGGGLGADPFGYLSAVGQNYGKEYGSTALGATVGGMTPVPFGGLIGGLLGRYYQQTGFGSPDIESPSPIPDTEAMPDRGGDGGGDYGITVAPEATFSATGTQPSGRRTIIDNFTNRFNRGVTRTL